MRDGRPCGDVQDRACCRAADVDGPGAALGGDEQVAGPDSGPRQLRRGQPQDGVVAWMPVARREAVGEVHGACPCPLIMMTPGRAPGSMAKAVSFPNEQRVPRT